MLYMSTFGKKVTSAVLTSAVVLTAIGSATGVQAAYTNLDAANKLANLGVVVDQSTNPSAYRLADTVQRQEALKIMMKLSGKEVSQGACTSPFADIADSDWACKYAVAALNNGFIAANPNFNPTDEVSKIEALKMVMKAKDIKKDMTVSDWKLGYVNAAVEKQIATAFSDFDASSERGVMFTWAAEAISPSEVAIEEEIDLGVLLDLGGDMEVETPEVVVETPEVVVETPEVVEEPVVLDEDNLTVSLNPETPSDGLAQDGADRTPLLVFDVVAGSEDVTLNQATFEFIGLGDNDNLKDVAIYNSRGEKVSKDKTFTKIVKEINFDKNIVVEAGQTMTLTVAGKIETTTVLADRGRDNSTYGIKLIDIKASSDVEGEDLVGALLVAATFSNVAAVEVKADRATGEVVIGDNIKLAGFEIDEKADNEDVIIKTITIHKEGQFDEDDITDLELLIEGEVVATDLIINSDDEIVASVNYELAAKTKVNVELRGTVTGSANDTIDFRLESTDDVYMIGKKSGMNVATTFDNNVIDSSTERGISDLNNIKAGELSIYAIDAEQDEIRADKDSVLLGSIKIVNIAGKNLEIENFGIKIKLTQDFDGSTPDVTFGTALEDIELVDANGSTYELSTTTTENNATDPSTLTAVFKDSNLDLSLPEGTSIFEIRADTLDYAGTPTFELSLDTSVDTQFKVVETEDDKVVTDITPSSLTWDEVETIIAGATNSNVPLADVSVVKGAENISAIQFEIEAEKASEVTFDKVVIKIEKNALDANGNVVNSTYVNATKDQVSQISIYKGSVSDSNLLDRVSGSRISLTTGEVTLDGFDVVIAADATEAFVVTITTADTTDAINNRIRASITGSNISLEDDDNDTVTVSTNLVGKQISIKDSGTLTLVADANNDANDEEKTILAGEESIIYSVDAIATNEAVNVEEVKFTLNSNLKRVVKSAKLYLDDKVVATASNSDVSDAANSVITFENISDLDFATETSELKLAILTETIGYEKIGEKKASVKVTKVEVIDAKWVDSNEDVTVTSLVNDSKEFAVVDVIVTPSVIATLANGTAKIKLTADSGNNTQLTSNASVVVDLVSLTFVDNGNGDANDNTYKVYEDGETAGAFAAINDAVNTTEVAKISFSDEVIVNILPKGVADKTYNLELDKTGVKYNTSLTTNLDSNLSVGSKTY